MDLSLSSNSGPEVPGRYGAPTRSRPIAFLMALAMSLLLLATLIYMGAFEPQGKRAGGQLVAINLSPPPGEKKNDSAKQQTEHKQSTVTHQEAAVAPKLPPRVPIPNDNKVEWPEGFVHMKHEDLAAADISQIRSAASAGSGNASGGGGNGGGQGPGGSTLYNAEWYRKPPDGALRGYMRPGQETGRWAMIACRTVENYHVDDCQELSEEPRGSGMARVLRQAAWQFLVRPPRVNGKPMIGAWVSIRYDFTQREMSTERAPLGD